MTRGQIGDIEQQKEQQLKDNEKINELKQKQEKAQIEIDNAGGKLDEDKKKQHEDAQKRIVSEIATLTEKAEKAKESIKNLESERDDKWKFLMRDLKEQTKDIVSKNARTIARSIRSMRHVRLPDDLSKVDGPDAPSVVSRKA